MTPDATIPEVLHFQPDGSGAGLYTEVVDLKQIGILDVSRASEIEFNPDTQQWEVFDATGTLVFADRSRDTCLRWERGYFNQSNHPPEPATIP
ncbi:MAG: hypothetical protein KDN19_22160 [Verrucomicrobiae bacterium]|nr:hypothetical protein [Verrucomicrobiae bacterium]